MGSKYDGVVFPTTERLQKLKETELKEFNEELTRTLDKLLRILKVNDTSNIISADRIEVNKEINFDAEYDNGNSGASTTVDWTNGNKQKLTLTDDATISFTHPSNPCNIVLKLVQDGTGNRNPSWDADVKWSNGGTEPDWSTGAGAIDIVTFYYDGTNFYGQAGFNFA